LLLGAAIQTEWFIVLHFLPCGLLHVPPSESSSTIAPSEIIDKPLSVAGPHVAVATGSSTAAAGLSRVPSEPNPEADSDFPDSLIDYFMVFGRAEREAAELWTFRKQLAGIALRSMCVSVAVGWLAMRAQHHGAQTHTFMLRLLMIFRVVSQAYRDPKSLSASTFSIRPLLLV